MLSTLDLAGRCVEINAAWRTWLGYRPEDLEGRPLLEITHPGDLKRATKLAAQVFRGEGAEALETRVRAKDGSWHWLRSTATYAADERLVYARSTDVTELKRVEAEREDLLKEVGRLARSDTLTGLPNRRALEEILPREMNRSRRSRSPLCLAMVDVDLFKSYNDTRGHPAGDALLRACARAWDGEVRSADLLARFGGEEFVVLLPDCENGEASAIVERLRAATPNDQTVSAGLARWDFEESADALLERADRALYEAKESGRDRLVEAAG
jgi:diguanylate cyclase (GGDEF)-like protein/PAS domain S-box-containing protein